MIYLILLPKLKMDFYKRQFLFMCIGAVMLVIFLSTDAISPPLYAIQLAPAYLLMSMFVSSYWVRVASLAVIVASGSLLLDIDWVVMLAGGSALTALGIFFERRLQWETSWRLYLYAAFSVVVYLTVYLGVDTVFGGTMLKLPLYEFVVMIFSALLCSQLLPFLYQFVKKQAKIHKELILSEKYQSVGQLAASISHEIRNPLTTARGFLQLMNVDKLSKEQFERYRKYAFEGLDHANHIITEYLNYSKPNVETAKTLNVKQEIESVVQWLHPYSVQKSVSIVTHHMSEQDPFVWAEPKQFQQCILNIMKNAIEAMPSGGLLTVHTRVVQDQVQILIRDTGVGMSAEQLKRIGKPYFTTKESGTGLGLMVVMSLVRAMNGKILFRSKLNQGTICEIHLMQVTQEV